MREHLATRMDDFRRTDSGIARAIAVVHYRGNRRKATTYGELARLAGRFAAYLATQNIVQGDRVLIWAENSAEWIAAFHGCLRRGVLAVPLDAAGSAGFAARVAADVRPRLAVGDARLLGGLASAHTGESIPTLAFEDWLDRLPATEMGAISGLDRATPLQILFTSGTTGDPKGVVITHGNVLASIGPIADGAQPYLRWERLVHPLRILHTLPLSHVFGQTMGLWVPPILKAELHFESRLAASRIVEIIRAERISVLAAVPRVLALLKAHLEATHAGLGARIAHSQTINNPWLRWWRFRAVHRAFGLKFWAFVSGGGALAGPLEQFWNTLGFVLVQGYGMTESTALIALNHPFHVARGTIGMPVPGSEVKLGPDGEVLVRGAMISSAIWQDGELRRREDEWLATGDLAQRQESGELRFLGRKSEVIVTAAGLNIHPEDIEAALEEQPEIAACAVVAMETPSGPEPCAVLACRGSGDRAATAIARANAKLADFQRISRWVLWPEPDLPRTSTGKVRRKPVAAWLTHIQAAAAAPRDGGPSGMNGAFGPSTDWLLALITQITGESHPGVGDELRLDEDLHLDSLGRVQLSAAIEERLGVAAGSERHEMVHTLGELRRFVAGASEGTEGPGDRRHAETRAREGWETGQQQNAISAAPHRRFLYPQWPWWPPLQWLRVAFLEAVQRPLTWLLAAPRVLGPAKPLPPGPLLIVGNHVTAYDGPLLQYALTGPLRRRIAVAMAGDMLDDLRRWRNPEWPPDRKGIYLLGPPAYWLVTALFNVFPLPRRRDFQLSFVHAGKAMDRGYSVMVFPEGARSAAGELARFRPGIGLLARQCGVPVVPTAIRGLGAMKTGQRRWFRSGILEVRIGEAIRFSAEDSEAAITERLHDEVEQLLGDKSSESASESGAKLRRIPDP